jgi:hypothetical protein
VAGAVPVTGPTAPEAAGGFETSAGTPLESEWEVLRKRAGEASRKRNKLAHRTAREYAEGKAGARVLLVPWRYSKAAMKKKRKPGKLTPEPNDSLGVRAVVECRLEFTALAAAILNWAFRASGKTEPFEKHAEKAGHAPTIATLLKQARATFQVTESLGWPSTRVAVWAIDLGPARNSARYSRV